jgi:hypothetical protein
VGRLPRSVVAVTVSVVLRLVSAALDAGRLAGEAEVVATGERRIVRDADELIRFVNAASRPEQTEPVAGTGQSDRGSG